jgi:hypothetical protein
MMPFLATMLSQILHSHKEKILIFLQQWKTNTSAHPILVVARKHNKKIPQNIVAPLSPTIARKHIKNKTQTFFCYTV